jgi:hypothetical protein
LTIREVKEFLRLDSDAEDAYLRILILLSREMCENYLRKELPRGKLSKSIKQAQLLIIGYFFENREGTKDGIPPAVYLLLNPYRKAEF